MMLVWVVVVYFGLLWVSCTCVVVGCGYWRCCGYWFGFWWCSLFVVCCYTFLICCVLGCIAWFWCFDSSW